MRCRCPGRTGGLRPSTDIVPDIGVPARGIPRFAGAPPRHLGAPVCRPVALVVGVHPDPAAGVVRGSGERSAEGEQAGRVGGVPKLDRAGDVVGAGIEPAAASAAVTAAGQDAPVGTECHRAESRRCRRDIRA